MLPYVMRQLMSDKRMFCYLPVTEEFFGVLEKETGTSKYKLIGENETPNGEYKNVVVVLESPHRSEFDDEGNPLRSANGTTGKKLRNEGFGLAVKINKAIGKIINKLTDESYNVYAMNAVQYQCSLGLTPIQPELRNCMFRAVWYSLKKDFIKRLEAKEPVLVINMCTGGEEPITNYKNSKKDTKQLSKFLASELPLNVMVEIAIEAVNDTLQFEHLHCLHPSAPGFKEAHIY